MPVKKMDDDMLRELWATRLTRKEIATVLKVSVSAVDVGVRRLDLPLRFQRHDAVFPQDAESDDCADQVASSDVEVEADPEPEDPQDRAIWRLSRAAQRARDRGVLPMVARWTESADGLIIATLGDYKQLWAAADEIGRGFGAVQARWHILRKLAAWQV